MLNDSITLAVDTLNSGVPTNLVLTRVDESDSGRSLYIGPDHEMGERDQLQFYRTLPKPAGKFKGVARSSFKFTKDVEVLDNEGNTIVAPYIFEVSQSIPVGVTDATRVIMRQRGIAALDDDTLMNKHAGDYPQY